MGVQGKSDNVTLYHVFFLTASLRLTREWKLFSKNYLRALKRILYDMDLLTLVRWLLQRAFKFEPPFGSGFELKRVIFS